MDTIALPTFMAKSISKATPPTSRTEATESPVAANTTTGDDGEESEVMFKKIRRFCVESTMPRSVSAVTDRVKFPPRATSGMPDKMKAV